MPENQGTLDSWEANAQYWDNGVLQDGNKYWKYLQEPTLDRFIAPRPGGRALDLATGNGLCARWLAKRIDTVVATDGTENMLKFATERTSPEEKKHISFQQLDVTQPAAFEAFLASPEAAGGFDVVLINMALMDISTLEPLADALPKLLKKDGIFVATMLHPVFFTSGAKRWVEFAEDPVTGVTKAKRGKIIRKYLDVAPWRGVSTPDQPAFQLYFHRPIHELFGTFLKRGLVLDAIEEPNFKEEHGNGRPESTASFTQLPAIMAFRFRKI